jgi:hypothetical protein
MKACLMTVCALGVAGLATAASAQISSINSVAVGTRFFNDFPNSTLNVTNNGLSLVRFEESNFGAGNFANRHIAMLSNNGTTPYLFQPGGNVDFAVTVRLSGLAAAEAGMFIGRIPNFPSGADANTGQFPVIPGNGEIAAFGSFLPFFSNNQPENAGMPRGARDQDFTLRFQYNAGAQTITYSVNGVSTAPLAVDPQNPFLTNTALGVYTQHVPGNTPGATADVSFSNFRITPAPASALLLGGLGALAAGRRRRA